MAKVGENICVGMLLYLLKAWKTAKSLMELVLLLESEKITFKKLIAGSFKFNKDFEEIKQQCLMHISFVIEMEDIRLYHQPGNKLGSHCHKFVPSSQWTIEKEWKLYSIAVDDKKQITTIFACTAH